MIATLIIGIGVLLVALLTAAIFALWILWYFEKGE